MSAGVLNRYRTDRVSETDWPEGTPVIGFFDWDCAPEGTTVQVKQFTNAPLEPFELVKRGGVWWCADEADEAPPFSSYELTRYAGVVVEGEQ